MELEMTRKITERCMIFSHQHVFCDISARSIWQVALTRN